MLGLGRITLLELHLLLQQLLLVLPNLLHLHLAFAIDFLLNLRLDDFVLLFRRDGLGGDAMSDLLLNLRELLVL